MNHFNYWINYFKSNLVYKADEPIENNKTAAELIENDKKALNKSMYDYMNTNLSSKQRELNNKFLTKLQIIRNLYERDR